MKFLISEHIYGVHNMDLYIRDGAICSYWVTQCYPGAIFHPLYLQLYVFLPLFLCLYGQFCGHLGFTYMYIIKMAAKH